MSQSSLHLALLRVFGINVCPTCGQRKEQKQCFCKTCYFALPQKFKSGLYASALDGDEFFDNYLAAMDHLIQIDMAVSPNMWPPNAKRMLDQTGLQEALNQARQRSANG